MAPGAIEVVRSNEFGAGAKGVGRGRRATVAMRWRANGIEEGGVNPSKVDGTR